MDYSIPKCNPGDLVRVILAPRGHPMHSIGVVLCTTAAPLSMKQKRYANIYMNGKIVMMAEDELWEVHVDKKF